MIGTVIIWGLVFGRWWKTTLIVSSIAWPAHLVMEDIMDAEPRLLLTAAGLAVANAAVGVAAHQTVLRLIRRLQNGISMSQPSESAQPGGRSPTRDGSQGPSWGPVVRDLVVAVAALVCIGTVVCYMASGYLGGVGAGGLLLWLLPALATYGLIKLRYHDERATARGLLVAAALIATLMVLGAPFTFWRFAVAALALWVAVIAVSIAPPPHTHPRR